MLILILFATHIYIYIYVYVYDNLKSSWWCSDDANIDFVYHTVYIYIYI